MKLLITGGAGFIGSNLIQHIIDKPEIARLVNLDCLTYAGHPANLESVAQHPKYVFEKVDLRDKAAVMRVVEQHEITHVMHLAAESHVDRSITGPGDFISTNIVGTFNLLEACRAVLEWQVRRQSVSPRLDRRSLWFARRDRLFHRDDAVCAELAVLREQGVERHAGARVSSHLRPEHGHHELLEQLRPVSISGEAHPGGHPKLLRAESRFRSMATA